MNQAIDINEKRVFWRRVLIAGLLILVISLIALVVLYFSGMSAAKAKAKADVALESDLDMDIAELSARTSVISSAAKSTLPFAILGSLILNLARFRLRKLKKLEGEMAKSLNQLR